MERLAIIARLRPGSEQRAAELIATGPPFDLQAGGLERHTVYLSTTEVIFVFEGHEVEKLVDELIEVPLETTMSRVFDRWRPLVEGPPRIAQEEFSWERGRSAAREREREREPEVFSIPG